MNGKDTIIDLKNIKKHKKSFAPLVIFFRPKILQKLINRKSYSRPLERGHSNYIKHKTHKYLVKYRKGEERLYFIGRIVWYE